MFVVPVLVQSTENIAIEKFANELIGNSKLESPLAINV